MKTNNLSKEEYEKLFDVCFETGILRRKIVVSNRVHLRDVVGSKDRCGYLRVNVNKKPQLVHRIIMIMAGMDINGKQTDHINHIRDDNRLENLRAVDQYENSKNQTLKKTNKSGVVGVSWKKQRNKWTANIQVNKKQYYLGMFLNKEEAITARQDANIKYGFHENHGLIGRCYDDKS
jgi:hypothetical protein